MEAHQLINNSIDCKPLPAWIKSLPRYQESAGLFVSLYPGTRRATVEVAGVEWSADSHEPDPELCCYPSNDRLLYVRKVADGYSWRAALIVRAAVCYVDVGGTAASVCEAAKAAMAAEFRRLGEYLGVGEVAYFRPCLVDLQHPWPQAFEFAVVGGAEKDGEDPGHSFKY